MTLSGGRNDACLRDFDLSFTSLGVNVDEMNEFMKQVRPPIERPKVGALKVK